MSTSDQNNPKERILITGAGGFLGSHIAHHFGTLGYPIAAVGRFAAAPEQATLYPNLWKLCGMTLPDTAFHNVVRAFQPTLMVHCAGTSSVVDSVSAPYSDFRRTVEVCAFCLETVRCLAPACRFVLLSSASVYGNPLSLPIDESAGMRPVSPYGYHKMLCETLAQEYQLLHGIKVAVIRIFSAYGERLNRQVVHDLCAKLSDPGTNPVVLFGTGEESRDFIHAHDVARAIECIHGADAAGTFNVASGSETSVRDLVRTVSGIMPHSKTIEYSGYPRRGDPVHWRASIDRVASLGYKPSIALPEGIARYVAWFLSQHKQGNGDRA